MGVWISGKVELLPSSRMHPFVLDSSTYLPISLFPFSLAMVVSVVFSKIPSTSV